MNKNAATYLPFAQYLWRQVRYCVLMFMESARESVLPKLLPVPDAPEQ